jgi:hypothetical protein
MYFQTVYRTACDLTGLSLLHISKKEVGENCVLLRELNSQQRILSHLEFLHVWNLQFFCLLHILPGYNDMMRLEQAWGQLEWINSWPTKWICQYALDVASFEKP